MIIGYNWQMFLHPVLMVLMTFTEYHLKIILNLIFEYLIVGVKKYFIAETHNTRGMAKWKMPDLNFRQVLIFIYLGLNKFHVGKVPKK